MTLIFLLTISIFSTNVSVIQASQVHSPASDIQLLYADALFDQGDYDAAILEFKRYIFYNRSLRSKLLSLRTQSDVLDYALYRIGQSHYYSYRLTEARKNLEQLLEDYPQSPFRLHARFMLGKTFMANEDFAGARNEFRLITTSNEDKKLSAQAQYLLAWSYLYERDWYSAVTEFRKVAQIQPFSPLSKKAEHLADTTLAGIRLPRKSPTIARWMSTFLPGSGQIYTGKITNGLISTAINAAFIYLLVDAIRDKRYVDTVGIYIIGARFYWGNIYNATQSALKYNQQMQERLFETLKNL